MTAAAYYLEQAGHLRFQLVAEINLANLFVSAKTFHRHMSTSIVLRESRNNSVMTCTLPKPRTPCNLPISAKEIRGG